MSSSSRAIGNVKRYYQLVDNGDVPGLLRLFRNDILYVRPGYTHLVGLDALQSFYETERMIADGLHRICSTVQGDEEIAVRGEFEGRLKSGALVSVGFSDFFRFDPNGLFVERRTYFDTPAV